MTITIDTATREDMFPILELIKEGGSADNATYPAFLGEPASKQAVFQVDSAIKAGLVKVARNGEGVIVGVIVSSKEHYVWNGKVFLASMWVYLTPSERRGTAGNAIVKAIKDISVEAKLPYVVTIHEAEHTKLLEKAGFRRVSSMYVFDGA